MQLQVQEIALDRILCDETAREPERRLVQSLHSFGQFEPVHVLPQADGHFELIDGSRRVAAARKLGWQTIAAIVETPDDAARPRDLKAIVINTQRKNLRQLHVARHARRLIEHEHYVQADLARELHLSPATLSYMLTVLECPDLVAAMEEEGLEFGAAKALASLPTPDRSDLLNELRALKQETGRTPSVRQVEQQVRERKGKPPVGAVTVEPIAALLRDLRAHGAPVDIRCVRATQTRLKITLQVAEEDQEWIDRLVAEAGEETSAPPGDTA
jgi:ParB/RepB/Spo0J family partition protein